MSSVSGAPLLVPSSSMEIVHTVGQKQKDDSGSVADKGTPKHGVDDEGIISDGISGKGVSEPWTQTTHRTKPRDDQFYLRSAIFEVEDVLFQLPIANFVQESEVFKTLFEVPQPSSPNSTSAEREDPNGVEHDVEGATDANPIRLVGVKKDDFKNLVRVMYARYATAIIPNGIFSFGGPRLTYRIAEPTPTKRSYPKPNGLLCSS